tara:strand:+ start:210 stop:602 length:393 start_codon:yes stop_codon:yes gene_type:complete
MQTFDLKKLFNREAKKNLIFVNEATSIPFDADFGEILKKTKSATKKLLTKDNRQKQFANYMATIDRLRKNKINLSGKFRLGTTTASPTRTISTVGRTVPNTSVSFSKTLDEYRARALRLAQAKYYQKQVS